VGYVFVRPAGFHSARGTNEEDAVGTCKVCCFLFLEILSGRDCDRLADVSLLTLKTAL
jgi:hypothetical protein